MPVTVGDVAFDTFSICENFVTTPHQLFLQSCAMSVSFVPVASSSRANALHFLNHRRPLVNIL